MKMIFLGCSLLLGLVLAACSIHKGNPYQDQSAERIYQQGHTYFQKHDWDKASEAYQALDAQYPFSEFSEHGDLEQIYAEYQQENQALALAAANRYVRLYPTGQHLDYVYYMRGVIGFENGRNFLERHTPYRMSEHDMTGYQGAYQDFQRVVSEYPKSAYQEDARRRMMFLVNTQAEHQLEVARFNYEMKAYVAAVNRATNVLVEYPKTPAVEGALEVMVASYRELGFPELAEASFKLLQANFPKNSLVLAGENP